MDIDPLTPSTSSPPQIDTAAQTPPASAGSVENQETRAPRNTNPHPWPHASSTHRTIPIYSALSLGPLIFHPPSSGLASLKAEFQHVLRGGPGVFLLEHVYCESMASILDRTSEVLAGILREEKEGGGGEEVRGPERVWNSFEKLARGDALAWLRYYSNVWYKVCGEAWVGEGARVNSQADFLRASGAGAGEFWCCGVLPPCGLCMDLAD